MYYLFTLLISISVPFSFHARSIKAPYALQSSHGDSTVNASLPKTEEILRTQFEDSVVTLYNELHLSQLDLDYDVFRYSMIGYSTVAQQGRLNDKGLLTVIDFTKPSTQKRFYIINLHTLQVMYYTYVSHGKNTGENDATSFSNVIHSNQSSLGFYLTAETYIGSKGYSLKLDGLERGYNDNLRPRAVVMHEADYVSEYWIKKYGRLGRSQGCPALPVGISKEIIDLIKDHSLIFAYYDDMTYLQNSAYLNIDQLFQNAAAMASANP